MREIKFRAWDKERGEMLKVNKIHWDGPTPGVWVEAWRLGRTMQYQISGQELLVLKQFTGLHDRNGEEIYEGDIVLFVYEAGDGKHMAHRLPVEFGPFCLEPFIAFKKIPKEVEVIGNIHENPELLEAKP